MRVFISPRVHYLHKHLTLCRKVLATGPLTVIPSYCRNVHQSIERRARPTTTGIYLKQETYPRSWAKAYATTTPGRPKGHTGKAKAKNTSTKANSSKSAAKPKPKKRLTENQKQIKAAEELKAEIRQLKVDALTEPKRLPEVGYVIAMAERIRGSKGSVETFKYAASHVKDLSPSDFEPYSMQAEANKATNRDTYEKWISSHSPIIIRKANLARKRLAHLTKNSTRKVKLPLLKDPRQVKTPMTGYVIFTKERHGSGDFKHLDGVQAVKQISQEWSSLPQSDKEKYHKLQEEDRERYHREYRSVYGEDPYSVKKLASSS